RGFSRDATCACLARNDRFAVLAFRGTTQDYRNILTDMDIRFYRDKSGARISDGFSKAYALVQDDIAAAVGALAVSLPLYITGHSLGGALAVIASTRIQPSDRIAACYTYGCPRIDARAAVGIASGDAVRRLNASGGNDGKSAAKAVTGYVERQGDGERADGCGDIVLHESVGFAESIGDSRAGFIAVKANVHIGEDIAVVL